MSKILCRGGGNENQDKKTMKILSFLVLIGTLGLGIFILYGNYRMSKIRDMSYEEVLKYTTKDNEDARITVGIIRDEKMEYTVYGNNGMTLPKYEYEYEIGSLTKTITTSLISKAILEGKMDLDSSIVI